MFFLSYYYNIHTNRFILFRLFCNKVINPLHIRVVPGSVLLYLSFCVSAPLSVFAVRSFAFIYFWNILLKKFYDSSHQTEKIYRCNVYMYAYSITFHRNSKWRVRNVLIQLIALRIKKQPLFNNVLTGCCSYYLGCIVSHMNIRVHGTKEVKI